jgi:hypothetical protein
MLYVELPRRQTPPELLAIADQDAREAACAAFVASVGFERIQVPREVEVAESEKPGAVQGFVDGQIARLAAEADAADERE